MKVIEVSLIVLSLKFFLNNILFDNQCQTCSKKNLENLNFWECFGNFLNEGSESRNIGAIKFYYYNRILQTKNWINWYIHIIKKRAVHKIIHF